MKGEGAALGNPADLLLCQHQSLWSYYVSFVVPLRTFKASRWPFVHRIKEYCHAKNFRILIVNTIMKTWLKCNYIFHIFFQSHYYS